RIISSFDSSPAWFRSQDIMFWWTCHALSRPQIPAEIPDIPLNDKNREERSNMLLISLIWSRGSFMDVKFSGQFTPRNKHEYPSQNHEQSTDRCGGTELGDPCKTDGI